MKGVYHGSNDFAEISNYSTPENWGNTPAAVATVRGTPEGLLDAVLVTPANDLAAAEALLREQAEEIAAVLVDPVPPRARACSRWKLSLSTGLRELISRKLDILLIYDEVIDFRFGHGGAQTRFGGEPDLTALGKIIGGGYPVGAGGRVQQRSWKRPPEDVGSSGTFTANPVTMRAGLCRHAPAHPRELSGAGCPWCRAGHWRGERAARGSRGDWPGLRHRLYCQHLLSTSGTCAIIGATYKQPRKKWQRPTRFTSPC